MNKLMMLKSKPGGNTRRLLAKKLAGLALDREHGAGELGAEVISFLRSLCPRQGVFSESLLLDILLFGQGLRVVRPAMAPLGNISLAIMELAQRTRLKSAVFGVRFMSYLKKQEKLVEVGPRRLAFKGARRMSKDAVVMTISRSSEVLALLLASRQKVKKVFALRSLPLGEGASLAGELRKAGLAVELLEDRQAAKTLRECNLVLLGADAVCEDGVVNKVGSLRLARLAHARGIPVWVAATSPKFIRAGDYTFKESRGKKKGLFERVPLKYISVIVSEKGCKEL